MGIEITDGDVLAILCLLSGRVYGTLINAANIEIRTGNFDLTRKGFGPIPINLKMGPRMRSIPRGAGVALSWE